MIEDVCRAIKEKRKEFGYSIEYVVEKTKLHPSVVKDIEDGNLSNISPAYLRGFIKIYAAFLGVDDKSALEEIDAHESYREKPKSFNKKVYPPETTTGQKRGKSTFSVDKKYIIAIATAIVAILITFFLFRFAAGTISKIFHPNTKAQQKVSPQEHVGLDSDKQLLASLTAKRKCFIRVVVDGKLLFEGVIDKGAIESWQAEREIEFKISDGSAVYLEVNGKPIPTLTSIRKPIKSLKITPSGITVDK